MVTRVCKLCQVRSRLPWPLLHLLEAELKKHAKMCATQEINTSIHFQQECGILETSSVQRGTLVGEGYGVGCMTEQTPTAGLNCAKTDICALISSHREQDRGNDNTIQIMCLSPSENAVTSWHCKSRAPTTYLWRTAVIPPSSCASELW